MKNKVVSRHFAININPNQLYKSYILPVIQHLYKTHKSNYDNILNIIKHGLY